MALTFTHFHPWQRWHKPHTPSKPGRQLQTVTTSDSGPDFPPHCCYCATHTCLTKPWEASAARASPPAKQQQLPQRYHPGTSLPVLAIEPTSVPAQGLAHRFPSLELDRSQIAKKPSVTKPSLLQLRFATDGRICHHPWSQEQELARASELRRPHRSPGHADPCSERAEANNVKPDILKSARLLF